ncbi:hypothetical protein Tco_1285488 [Tanacetum coccineum]
MGCIDCRDYMKKKAELERNAKRKSLHKMEAMLVAARIQDNERQFSMDEQNKVLKKLEALLKEQKWIKDFIPMDSKKGSGEEQSAEKEKELSEEELQKLLVVVPVEEVYVEALQVKYPIIDWEVYSEDTRRYWRIIRVGNHTEAYQIFADMLKKFDRDDLVKLWDLVKKRFSTTEPTDDKEKELWVELKRLFEPDNDDILWKLQRYMHDPLVWRLYDTCGVHHVSSVRGHDIFMLVEKEYPLTRGTLGLMMVARLLVEADSEMSRELLRKIFYQANRPRQGGLLGIKASQGSTTIDECMHLKMQIEKMLKVGKLSHLIKELKQSNRKDQAKTAKKGGNLRKGQTADNTDGTTMAEGEEDGTEGPMIIEAEMGGHFVHRMYVDGGSSFEIMYEHCFNKFCLEIGDEEHSSFAWMNFMVIRSPSPYNKIIGRPRVRRIQAVPSHRMLKFPMTGGMVTLRSNRIIPLECTMVSGPGVPQPVINQVIEEKIQVAIHPEYP